MRNHKKVYIIVIVVLVLIACIGGIAYKMFFSEKDQPAKGAQVQDMSNEKRDETLLANPSGTKIEEEKTKKPESLPLEYSEAGRISGEEETEAP